jgi:hypothetical protein
MRLSRLRSLLTSALMALAATAGAQTTDAPSAPSAALREAHVYSFPLHEMGRVRLNQLGNGTAPGRQTLGKWNHLRKLAGPADRGVTTPNNDTLYSIAWLDLASGPVTLSLPDTNGRYYSAAVIDAYTNNVAVLGQRLTGTRAENFVLVGPSWKDALPPQSRVVRATTNDVMVLVRIVVNGPEDLPAVQALQDKLTLTPVAAATPAPLWQRTFNAGTPPAESYVNIVNEMLARNPPPPYEAPLLARLSAVGLCGAACNWETLTPELKQQWTQAMPALQAGLRQLAPQVPPQAGSWTQVRPNLGNFGTDYAYRAFIALTGLLALDPAEAIYPSTRVDAKRQPLNGANRYRIRIPAAGLPTDAFWSLSLYQIEADGRLFFVENAANRYAIGDRTPGLQRNADGSIDLWVQHAAPDAKQQANWLPAPAGGFALVLRAYQPRAEFRDGRFVLPPVEKLD